MDPRNVYEQRHEVQILDIREHEEFAAGRIDGAWHVPIAELPARLRQLDSQRPIVTVCRSGNRSGEAAKFLKSSGFAAENMEGGLKRWADEGLPLTAPNGDPGRVA